MDKKDSDSKRLSFEGIEEMIGKILTVVSDVEGRLETYTGKLIGTDEEYLIFKEKKRKAYIPKNMEKNYHLASQTI